MNITPYTGVHQNQSIHQDVAPILQEFASKLATSHNEGFLQGQGLVVMGNDGVRYHCTSATSSSQHYYNQANNTTVKQISQSHSFVPQTQAADSTNNQSCLNARAHQKADASTMTEKETPPNDSFLNQLIQQECNKTSYPVPSHPWQSIAGPPGSTVADYLSRLPASTLPYTLHHFLKFSSIPEPMPKKDADVKAKKKRKYKRKPYIPKPPRPKLGEIRLTTALDGSMLYCCPDCQMAYPERELLEQHLYVHRLERRFVCNICGTRLKRKEHLDRHKQGHNPERPFTCSVCMKAFKRNEHLSRHFVIHSGDKSQACTECGKAFFRKDHLSKHAQSHITKRLRTELITQKGSQPHGHQSLVSIGLQPHAMNAGAFMAGASIPILSS